VKRLAVFSDVTNPFALTVVEQLDTAARAKGMTLQRVDIRSASDLDAALEAVLREGAQAIYLYPLRLFRPEMERISQFAIKHRMPTIGVNNLAYLDNGLLFFHSPSVAEEDQRLASYVDRILKGAKPGDLPVERPTKFEFVIDQRTADAIGLVIPKALLLRADRLVR
jgi:putative ABC transport system substrate-binding protein